MSVIVLQPRNLHWIQGAADDPSDLCAHGDVTFQIDGDTLLDTTGRDLTLSAAALYLLRTLSNPHTKLKQVGEHLFPCCGFAMWEIDGDEDVVICGCANGEDFEVDHRVVVVQAPDARESKVIAGVVIRSVDGREWKVDWREWQAAVFWFADRVSDFYAACSPKEPFGEYAPGFNRFRSEWTWRRGRPLGQPA